MGNVVQGAYGIKPFWRLARLTIATQPSQYLLSFNQIDKKHAGFQGHCYAPSWSGTPPLQNISRQKMLNEADGFSFRPPFPSKKFGRHQVDLLLYNQAVPVYLYRGEGPGAQVVSTAELDSISVRKDYQYRSTYLPRQPNMAPTFLNGLS